MNRLRQFVAALTALAILASTVVAAPCCCVRPAPQKHSCCAKVVHVAAPHSCCTKQAIETVASASHTGCCCVKAPPASPTNPSNSAQPSSPAVALPVATLDVLGYTSPDVSYFSRPPSDRIGLSGPALLARYCIWLI